MSEHHTLEIPIDCRLGCCSLWLAGVVLAVLDSLDEQVGILALWSVVLLLVATAWTVAQLLAYSRRVTLEVMSYEHRQQTPAMEPGRLVEL